MRTLVDASVWIPYLTGRRSPRADWLDATLGRAALLVADLTLLEVLRGLPDDAEREQAREALFKFPVISTGGPDLAIKAAANLRTLTAAGAPQPPLPQALIATACLAHDYHLLHEDPAYAPFEQHLGLKAPGTVVEMW